MTKALSITSTRHATAITLYAGLAGLGLLHILDVAGHEWVTNVAGEELTSLWASLYFIGPAIALASATLAPSIRIPVYPLWGEAFGCALIAATNVFIVYCVLDQLGFAAAANVSTTLGVIAVGMLARIWQIVREQRHMRRGLEHPRPADPAPLAEADNNRG